MKRGLPCVLLWSLLSGCGDAELAKQLQQQTSELERVQSRLGKLEWQIRTQLLAPALTFSTDQLQFSLDERHFEPRVVGAVTVQARGEQVPALLYAEVEVVVTWVDGTAPVRQTTLIRMDQGRADIPLMMAIPTHRVAKDDIRVQVNVLGWTLGYPAG